MLKYRALSHLDSNVSSAYTVEERKTNKQFVMRRLEVGDQSIADAADKQFNDVINNCTDNTRVAGYRECFVNFSKLESALYVCVIGEFFPLGSLKRLLGELRNKGVSVAESEVRKWYAQLLEGIDGLHRGGRVHRRVRSSNVFVRNTGLVLGYVGLQIEEGDILREFRSILPPNYHNAAKNANRDLTSSFDMWCLGILLLEICTNSLNGLSELELVLCRDDSEEIDLEIKKIIGSIDDIYSKDLVNVISLCLQSNSATRCTTSDLGSLPFTQDCLSLINSPLLARIRLEETSNLPIAPSIYSISTVLQYMRDNASIRQCQLIGIDMLLVCVNNREDLNNSDKRFIRSVVEQYSDIILFQIASVKLFVSSLRYSVEDPMEVLLTPPYIDIVAKITMQQTDTTELFGICCVYLLMVSYHENNSALIANYGIISHVIEVVSLYNTDTSSTCLTHVCGLLWGLTVSPGNLRALTELNALEWSLDIIQHFEDNPTVLLPSFNLVWSLFQDKINLHKAYYCDVVNISIKILNKYSLVHELCTVVLSILVVVCEVESCAFQLLADESSGLFALLEFMKNEFSHLPIVMKTIELLNVQFKYKDLKEELLSLELRYILQNWFETTQLPIINELIEKLDSV